MKFVSVEFKGTENYGILTEEGIINLSPIFNHKYSKMKDILEAQAFPELIKAAKIMSPDLQMADITMLCPVTNPEKIICVGVNYNNRNAEYKDNSNDPKFPSIFMRTPGSFTGHDTNLVRPPESPQLDYEGEITLIIGKAGRRIKEEDALDHIAGLTIMNEGTIRDWVRHAKFNVTQGKNFCNTGSFGPHISSMDEFGELTDMRIQTRVNGELRQNDTTASMMFPIRYLISYISTFCELKAGDVIATGTPVGAGARFDPPKYLVPGDIVEVTAEGIGTLRNGIEDEVI